MRKALLILCALISGFISTAGIISVPINATDNVKSGKLSTNEILAQLDVNAFLALTPAKVQELTGRKMNFFQKVSLRQTQKKVKKHPEFLQKINYKTFSGNDDRKFHWSTWAAFGCGVATLGLLFFSIPAVVFGIIGIIKSGPNKEYKGVGFAIAGLALGVIGLFVWVILAAAIIAGY